VTFAGLSAEGAQLYLTLPETGSTWPKRALKTYERVFLAAGRTQPVTLSLTLRDLARFDPQSSRWRVDAGQYIVHVGSSSADIRHQFTRAVEEPK
jgi:beta-glucosidase